MHTKRRDGWLVFILNNKAERLNTISALFGAIAAVFGVILLVLLAVREGNLWKIISFSIYGVTLILVYVFATLYHGSSGRAKALFSKLDHLSIYLLIAGTYTPFTLVTLRDSVGLLTMSGLYCLLLGGLFYSVGVVFYLLDQKVSYFHGIWHIFVMSGSLSHYFAILYYVA